MTPDEWKKVSEIYHAASDLDAADRTAFLDRQCDGDEHLRREVESLLAASDAAGDFISEPVVGAFASDLLKSKTLSPGETLGHYRVLSKIGTGGMGEVFLASDTKLGRNVALKTLSAMFDDDESFLRRFRNEARAAASLNHPHVATVYSVEEQNGRPFIALEYIDGKTLDSMMSAGGTDVETFAKWFVPIALALDHAHSRGVVHRDIKPGNIMVTTDGIVKILDFGLAYFRPPTEDIHDTDITQAGQLLGTPSYMSPEQAQGKEVDRRSDIFSLGIVMYEAITGQRPFTGDSHAEVVSNVLKSDPPPVSKVRPDVPRAISDMIVRCLSKTRRGRIQNAGAIAEILRPFEHRTSEKLSTDSSLRRFYREMRSRSSLVWLGPAALAVLLLAAGGWYFFSRAKEAPPVNFANMTIRRLSQSNDVVFASITPDGKAIVYNTIAPDGDRTLWLRRIDDRNALKLVDRQPVQFWGGLTANADSSQIYYVNADRSGTESAMYRVSAHGGTPRKLAEGVNDLGSLTADGKRILYVRYKKTMQILSANSDDGSDERLIFETDPTNTIFRDPHYSADGRFIYFSRMDRIDGVEYWRLIRITAEGGEETDILPKQVEKIGEIAVLADGKGILMNATDPASNLSQIFYVSLADASVTRVTNDLNSYFGVSVDRDGRSIVAAQRWDEKRVWVGDVDSLADAKPITQEATVFRTSDWTPDGRIVYDAVDNNRSHVWISDADGGNRQQLTANDTGGSYPRVSGDGKYIVFTSKRTGQDQVWRMNIDGGNQTLLTPTDGVANSPRFAPDGQTIYFHWARGSRALLGRVSVNGGEITELERFSETEWAISPDGTRVAYPFWDTPSKGYKVGVMRFDQPLPDVVIDAAPIYLLKWKPDGSSLLVREREAGENPFSTIVEHNLTTKKSSIFLSTAPDYVIDIAFSRDQKRASIVRGRLLTDAVMLSAPSKP